VRAHHQVGVDKDEDVQVAHVEPIVSVAQCYYSERKLKLE